MTQMDNELTTLSRHASMLNLALHQYSLSPRQGLQALRDSLVELQAISQLTTYHETFYQQLAVFIKAVDGLLASGAVYSQDHQVAFLEAVDALLQFALGSQCEDERCLQMLVLLSSKRSCWQVLQRILVDPCPANYVSYDARWLDNREHYHEVESYLRQFAELGEVSFRLAAVNDAGFVGQFSLNSVQSLAWLRQRFPMFRWEPSIKAHDESLKEMFELIYWLFFQPTVLGRQSRQRLLEVIERQARELFYRPFSSLFPADRMKDLDDATRPVAFLSHAPLLTYDRSSKALPIRLGGFFYAAVGEYDKQHRQILAFNDLHRLERDLISSFLYLVDTQFGCFAFDQQECLGRYHVAEDDLQLLGQTSYFVAPSGVMAELILQPPIFTLKSEPLSCSLQDVSHVVVIKQGGAYFALPYRRVLEVEGICAVARHANGFIKNVWMRQSGEPLLEPWLKPQLMPDEWSLLPLSNKNTTSSKNGYYLGEVDGVMFWIESALVTDVLPYCRQYNYTSFEHVGVSYHSFMLHDGLCFFQTLPISSVDEQDDFSVMEEKFSVILEAMGNAMVLNLLSCDWHECLPEADYVREFNADCKPQQGDNKKSVFASLRGREVLINNENYLSFVTSFGSLSSLA